MDLLVVKLPDMLSKEEFFQRKLICNFLICHSLICNSFIDNALGSVVRKVDSTIHRIMKPKSNETKDTQLARGQKYL